MKSISGAALVLVLWLIALLTAVVGAFALTAKVEQLQGRVMADSAMGQEHARAGIEYALSRLQGDAGRPRWHPDGRRYRWQFDGVRVDLRLLDEAGKVDLNLADAALLAGLMQVLDVAPETSRQLAAAILDWRDRDDLQQPGGGAENAQYAAAGLPYGAKNAPFESTAELRRVLGMEPDLYLRLRPLVTVFGTARPDPRFAPAPVLSAMGLDADLLIAQRAVDALPTADAPDGPAAMMGSGTYSIESRAQLGGARETVLRVVVRIGPSPVPGAAYTVMRWQQGNETR